MGSSTERFEEGRHCGVGEEVEFGVGDWARAEPKQAVGRTSEQ